MTGSVIFDFTHPPWMPLVAFAPLQLSLGIGRVALVCKNWRGILAVSRCAVERLSARSDSDSAQEAGWHDAPRVSTIKPARPAL